MSQYLVAATKPWNLEAFARRVPQLPGQWALVSAPEHLGPTVERLRPRYVFFPHWSWRVPEEVRANAECVAFHMTDLPYGRGGSPLQNLIVRGHRSTRLTALRMDQALDAGPVYLKRDLGLQGSARSILERAADLAFDMMAEIVANEPEPVPQEGEAVVFERRTPDMSRLPKDGDIRGLYDHIRMLDAETYPRAFLDHGRFRLELHGAELDPEQGEVQSRAHIRPNPESED